MRFFSILLLMTISIQTKSFEEGYVYNNDIKIVYRDYGPKDGDPILLVQGLGGQLINWPDHLLEFLIKNNFRPIVFDNRDSGLSSRFESELFQEKNRSRTINSTYQKDSSWAVRRAVKFLDEKEPQEMILWMSDEPTSYEFAGRKFAIANSQEPEKQSVLLPVYTPTSSEVVTQAFIEHCCQAYKMDHNGLHGFYHWMRVLQNGRQLAKAENANIKVVELFSLLHDTQRRNENYDPEHGIRAAQFARTIRGSWFDVTDTEMELLSEALIHHSEGYTDGDVTVRVCWDADRLDLGRVGIEPKPDRLCTVSAVQGYKRINLRALQSMKPGSLLFTFSCSQAVDDALFTNTLVAAAIQAGRNVRILHRLHQPPDHPVNVFHPEGSYLKGLVLRVD